MPLTNRPSVTTYQVGQTVYIPYLGANNNPQAAVVEKTESVVTDVDNNNTAEQVNNYFFVGGGNFSLPESQVFVSAAALETYLDNLIDAL